MSRLFHLAQRVLVFLLYAPLLNARHDHDYAFASICPRRCVFVPSLLIPQFAPTKRDGECSRCIHHSKTSAIIRCSTRTCGRGAHQHSREWAVVNNMVGAGFPRVEINRSLARPLRQSVKAIPRRSCVRGSKQHKVSSGQYQHEDKGQRDHSRKNSNDWPLVLPPALIRADGVAKTYASRRWFESHRKSVALHETRLVLEGPGPFAFVGNSGSGKSTFLQLVCGLCSPSEGNIRIEISGPEAFVGLSNATVSGQNREPEAGEAATQRAACVADKSGKSRGNGASTEPRRILTRGVYIDRLSIGTMIQNPARSISDAMEGVLINADGDSTRVDALRRSIQILLDATGLAKSLHKRCKDLTRGQHLRLVLCLGVAHALAELEHYVPDPKDGSEVVWQVAPGPVLCLDEFLDMEDPRVRGPVEDAVAGLCAVGVTILFATHVMEHVEGIAASVQRLVTANKCCDGSSYRVVVFSRGRVARISGLGDTSYVQWKKDDSAERGARRII